MKKQRVETANLPESVHRQLNTYALVASAAGVTVLALAQPSHAKIIYTRAHKKLPLNRDFFVDINHDGINDFKFHISASGNLLPPSATGGRFASLSVSARNSANGMIGYRQNGFGVASALPAGSSIGSKKLFVGRSVRVAMAGYATVQGQGGYFGKWFDVRNRYLGLKFVIKGATHYGWARLNVKVLVDNQNRATVHALLTGYAYETIPNKPIIAGKTHGSDMVVKHNTLGRLAAGAIGR